MNLFSKATLSALFVVAQALAMEAPISPQEALRDKSDICSVILRDHYESHKEQEAVARMINPLLKAFSITRSYAPTCHETLKYVHVTTHSQPIDAFQYMRIEICNKSLGKTSTVSQRRADILVTLLTKVRKNTEKDENHYQTVSCVAEIRDGLRIFAGLKTEETDCIIEHPENVQITLSRVSE